MSMPYGESNFETTTSEASTCNGGKILFRIRDACHIDDKMKVSLHKRQVDRCSWFQQELYPHRHTPIDDLNYTERCNSVEK